MGAACIKVTKYFLFLFNLLFFVSMAWYLPSYFSSCSKPLAPDLQRTVAGAEDRGWPMALSGGSQAIPRIPGKRPDCCPRPFPIMEPAGLVLTKAGGNVGKGKNQGSPASVVKLEEDPGISEPALATTFHVKNILSQPQAPVVCHTP